MHSVVSEGPQKFRSDQRAAIYQNNLTFGEKIQEFFDKIREAILEKSYLTGELNRFIHDQNKVQTLRSLFQVYCKMRRIDFKLNPQRNIKLLFFQ